MNEINHEIDVETSNGINNDDLNSTETKLDDELLNDIWTYHFHDPNNDDWTLSSYIRLCDVSSVVDFWKVHKALKDKLKNGMFFLMREYSNPIWDDKTNIDGGCLSIKVLKDNLTDYWEQLCKRLLGETLLKEEHKDKWDLINGISTSPKRYFCIVKIWLRNNDLNTKDYFNIPDNFYGDIIYRENRENIKRNNEVS